MVSDGLFVFLFIHQRKHEDNHCWRWRGLSR